MIPPMTCTHYDGCSNPGVVIVKSDTNGLEAGCLLHAANIIGSIVDNGRKIRIGFKERPDARPRWVAIDLTDARRVAV